MRTTLAKIYLFLAATVLISLSSPALAQNKENGDIQPPLINSPSGKPASDSTILPTLMLQGSLEGTPSSAVFCMPFTLRYTFKSTSTEKLPASTNALKLEIKSSDTGQPVYARQLPLVLEPATLLIDKLEFPTGKYVVTLKASIKNQNLQIARDFVLAEQALVVTAPIIVTRGKSALPRVLLWLGKNSTTLQQAVAVKIVQQAFDDAGAFFTIVDKEEDFTNQAMSGLFNTYVLFETDEMIEQAGCETASCGDRAS